MFPFTKPKQPAPLDLEVPKTWDALTTEQLEEVSRIFVDSAKAYTATGQYSEADVLSRCFLALAGLRVLSPMLHDDDDDEEDPSKSFFECEFVDEAVRKRKQMHNGQIIPIRIYLNELLYLAVGTPEVDKKGSFKGMKGGLQWLLNSCDRTIFPYPELTFPGTGKGKKKTPDVTFQGPAILMQNFSWRQYRIASDYMGFIPKVENSLLTMRKNSVKFGSTRIKAQEEQLQQVRAEFLATLFNASIPHINEETGQQETSYYYVSSQCADNAHFFLDFPEEKFQAILFWWQGMMHYLSKQYPKVFKKEKVGRSGPEDDPFKLYTRSTTTMIKYAATNEEQVNKTTYTIILQHINDMAEENERIDKMKKK